jgi:hypothetical protein
VSMQNFNSPMAAAELMVRAGANVITVMDGFAWDSHGDTDGGDVRAQMTGRILPGLKTFINRMMVNDVTKGDFEVTLIIGGDFSRSLPGSDHANGLSCSIIGPSIKNGTTGKCNADVGLMQGTGSWPQMWSFLGEVTGLTGAKNPFGANTHKGTLMR